MSKMGLLLQTVKRAGLYANLLEKVSAQPGPQAFSARSILDSTVSSDVTERYFPRRSALDPIGWMETK